MGRVVPEGWPEVRRRIKKAEAPQWKPWFAWYPVDCEGDRVWLEWIERKREWYGAYDGYYPLDSFRNARLSSPLLNAEHEVVR